MSRPSPCTHRARFCLAPHHTRAPPQPGPARGRWDLYRERPAAARLEVRVAALPAAARASDAGATATVSEFAMRPGAPGPLWPLPWGALAWAVGFVGSMGSGNSVLGEWGSRKERWGGPPTWPCGGILAVGMLGVTAAVAVSGIWGQSAVTSGKCRLNLGGLGAPPPPAPKSLKEGRQEVSRTDRCDSHNCDQE